MFELADVRYIEGAPFEWRRVLTPGLPVRLDFVEQGFAVLTPTDKFAITWDGVTHLAARGPDVPEHRCVYYWPKRHLFTLVRHLTERKESYCWLAVGLAESGDEMIFEVEQMLRPELEEVLGSHGG